MRKIALLLVFCLSLSFCLVGCGSNKTDSILKTPTRIESLNYSDFVISTASQLNNISATVIGNSQVGTNADMEKADYIENIFNEIGLSNVSKVPVMLNSWNFSNVTLTVDCNCADKTEVNFRIMGSYPYRYSFQELDTEIIYISKSSELNIETIRNKGVLVEPYSNTEIEELEKFVYEIMQYNPAFVLVTTTFEDFYGYRVNTNYFENITCPLFAVSYSSYSNMRNYINKSTNPVKSIDAKITANSTLSAELSESYFVVGEIKGKSDKCVYVTAHRDTIHGGYMESSLSVGQVAAIASYLKSENYTPDYTIKFVITTGQEWGIIGQGENAGIREYIKTLSEDELNNIKGVLVFNGSYPCAFNVFTTTMVGNSDELLKDITNYNTKYYETYSNLQNLNEVKEFNSLEYMTEAEEWLKIGIPTVLTAETNTGRYYRAGTSEDIDLCEVDTDILNFLVNYYMGVVKIMASK